jgi:hypothetical protein
MSLSQSPCSVKDATDPSTPDREPPQKKRRNMNPLAPNYKEARCMVKSQLADSWLVKRAVEITPEKIINKYKSAVNASLAAKRKAMIQTPTVVETSIHSNASAAIQSRVATALDAPQKALRRAAMQYFFVAQLESPQESEWTALQTVQTVIRHLGMPPRGSDAGVKEQLRHILAAQSGDKRVESRG